MESGLELRCATISGARQPPPAAPAAPARAERQLPAAPLLFSESLRALDPRAASLSQRLLEAERRVDFAIGHSRQCLEAEYRLAPTHTSPLPLPAMACAPAQIVRSLRITVYMQLEEAPTSIPTAQRVAHWTVQLTGRLFEGSAGSGSGEQELEGVDLGQYLQAIRFEVNCEPKVVVDYPARGVYQISDRLTRACECA